MKDLVKMVMAIMVLSFMGLNASSILYEDAEQGSINKWSIYANFDGEATVSNVYDEEKQSRVIKLKGTGISSGYILGNWEEHEGAWNNTKQKVISWQMKMTSPFVIFVRVMTTTGAKYIYYTDAETSNGKEGSLYIHIGLGKKFKFNKWQTFSRDLQADLQKYDPDNNITAVNAFLVRGDGFIDDVELHSNVSNSETSLPTTSSEYN